jgi:hypothetical protein
VWGKRKAVGRKHRVCFEPINFEIEVGQEGMCGGEGGLLYKKTAAG